ncbi:hypothetical protein ABPG72_022483 [Tetrahymena utriculariae]
MVTGDQPPTDAAIAKEVNIVPQKIITNEDLMENDHTLNWFSASEQCEAIVVYGDRILESFEKSIEEKRESPNFYLHQQVKKPYSIFVRTTPAQKLQIVDACQKEGFIVVATGDGVNDSPAIKKADIDAADMILLDDDFASIVLGVEEGRKIFDNLKKSCVYLLTSNMTEIVPFLAFIILILPIPLSINVFACKSRKMSFATTSLNTVMLQGIIFETSVLCFLRIVPGVQEVFGGRPYEFRVFCHGLFFRVCLLLWEETRKFTTRTFRCFFKYAYW